MELINTNSENSFDPTPKLKSSPVPILFIPFDYDENKCNYCGNAYSETLALKQKYCKNCLFWYIKYITDDDTYLDVQYIQLQIILDVLNIKQLEILIIVQETFKNGVKIALTLHILIKYFRFDIIV